MMFQQSEAAQPQDGPRPLNVPDRPASTTSTASSGRYNLRRTVTRVRREQAARPRSTTPINLENSRTFATSPEIPEGTGRPASALNVNVEDEVNQNGRRSRVQDGESGSEEQQARRPRLMNFRGLNLEGDNGRSLYFTFPWRNQQQVNHLVLVRVAHLEPTASETGVEPGSGALQWTLFFLLPQSDLTPAAIDPDTTTIDPGAVLTEAFTVFNALLSESSLTYDELVRLQEMLGFVNRGVSQEQIDEQLKTHLFKTGETSNCGNSCSICLVDYQNDESLRKLPCAHCYHSECIDKWLTRVNHCPLCRREAIVR